MKKYKIIGLTLWTIANAFLTLWLWKYLLITPLFVVQIIISACCSILFCIEFSSRVMRIVENVVMTFLTLLSLCYIIHFRQPVGFITVFSCATLIIKNILCERKKQPNRFVTRLVSLITFVVLLVSIGFTVWEFTVSKQTGLANGQTAIWSVADENFFDLLAKDCTTQEEVVRKGYEWIVENIKYDYSCAYFCNYQYFNIEKTLDTKMGICFDYSCLFASYCRSQNVPCYVVDGDARENRQYHHTWNRVYFNGSWWDVDTTHDATSDNKYGFSKLNALNDIDELYYITRIY